MKYLTDENISLRFLNALQRNLPDLDVVRVQDVGLQGASDSEIVEWAGKESRVLITKDKATIPPLVSVLLESNHLVYRVMVIRPNVTIASVIEMISLIEEVGLEGDWDYPLRWIP